MIRGDGAAEAARETRRWLAQGGRWASAQAIARVFGCLDGMVDAVEAIVGREATEALRATVRGLMLGWTRVPDDERDPEIAWVCGLLATVEGRCELLETIQRVQERRGVQAGEFEGIFQEAAERGARKRAAGAMAGAPA
jgi:hypothetical protein